MVCCLQEELAGNIANLTDVFHTPDIGKSWS